VNGEPASDPSGSRPSPRHGRNRRSGRVAAGIALALLALSACSAPPGPRSYLALPLHADGSPATVPLVVEGSVCRARVMLVGTMHSRNPRDPQFARIEALYAQFKPTLILHENVTPSRPAADRDTAIRRDAEIGFMQLLAAEGAVEYRSGDLPERDEFRKLIADSDPLQLLVFLTGQRLLLGMASEAAAAADYPGFYRDYLVANGFPYRAAWSTWAGFKSAYRDVVGADYDPSAFDADVFSPIRNLGPLNAIARRAHSERDRHLLNEIVRAAARGQQRIMVVFGAWHVLALEPVIRPDKACAPAVRLTKVELS
jgi:hypothetical protein